VTDDGITHLTEGDFVIIPKGTRHRLILTILVKCLLIEVEGTLDKENTGGTYYQTISDFLNKGESYL
jgi:mannose-6-phosphate isomerase-like protein (cupin superfamily)